MQIWVPMQLNKKIGAISKQPLVLFLKELELGCTSQLYDDFKLIIQH
jgi:hypothetical protein